MSLKNWLNEGRLRAHRPSPKEISDLFRVVDRDIADALIANLSPDRRFATAYNAALQLATIVLRASGHRTSGTARHWTTFQVLPDIMGHGEKARADYLDSCRRKRNTADYDVAGRISDTEVQEILDEVRAFRNDVAGWTRKNHPRLWSR